MGGTCGTCGKEENRMQDMVKKTSKNIISQTKSKWEGHSNMDIKFKKNVGNFYWISLAENTNNC